MPRLQMATGNRTRALFDRDHIVSARIQAGHVVVR